MSVCLCVTIPRNIGMIPLILAILYKVLNSDRFFIIFFIKLLGLSATQASKDTCVQPVPLIVT